MRILVKVFTSLALAALITTGCFAAGSKPKNRVVGTWTMQSSKLDPDGANTNVMGPNPQGQLIFTEDMTFAVVARDPSIPNFANNDRSKGTPEENRAVVERSLALFGTYTVDANGDFASQRVIAASFPNWSGMSRTTTALRLVVDGDTMTEYLEDPGAPKIRIIWKRVRAPGRS